MNVSTGDVITPDVVKYEFSGISDVEGILKLISEIVDLKDMWRKFFLLRFLLLLGRNNLQKYAIICSVTEFLKKNTYARKCLKKWLKLDISSQIKRRQFDNNDKKGRLSVGWRIFSDKIF